MGEEVQAIQKTCRKCRISKDITQFSRSARHPDGRHSFCKVCAQEIKSKWYRENKERILEEARTYRKENHEHVCKLRRKRYQESPEPARDRARKWHHENSGRVRESKLKRLYGIASSEYIKLHDAQQGRCATCEKKGEQLVIDHCHITNKLRGLLCQNCNLGLGLLKDNIKTLLKAASYLQKHANS